MIEIYFRWFRFGRYFTSFIPTIFGEDMTRTGKDFMELLDVFDVVFLLDHPAFSFPYLAPPNYFYLGHFQLENRVTKPLPPLYIDFLANCPHQHTFFVSFGSYIQDIFSVYQKFQIVLEAFRDMEVCFIMKLPEYVTERYQLSRRQFLVQSWVPQRDLLGSGKMSGFVSHCGNNGRMESIFYNVPLMCIPLFGDQYHNARLVHRNDFGVYLRKEDLSVGSIQSSIEDILAKRDAFTGNMRNAVEIARSDPGAGISVLKFYVDLLIKNGNAGFLKNKIIPKQWYYEVGNIDFVLLAFIFTMVVICAILLCIWSSLLRCARVVSKKIKTD